MFYGVDSQQFIYLPPNAGQLNSTLTLGELSIFIWQIGLLVSFWSRWDYRAKVWHHNMSYITWVLGYKGSPLLNLSSMFSLEFHIYHAAAPGRETGREGMGKQGTVWMLLHSLRDEDGEWILSAQRDEKDGEGERIQNFLRLILWTDTGWTKIYISLLQMFT